MRILLQVSTFPEHNRSPALKRNREVWLVGRNDEVSIRPGHILDCPELGLVASIVLRKADNPVLRCCQGVTIAVKETDAAGQHRQ